MKHRKVLRILGIAVILALLVVAIPAAPAQAAYYLYVTPASGEIGSSATVTGTGLTPTTDPANPKYVVVYFSNQAPITSAYIDTQIIVYETVVPLKSTDTIGNFTYSFSIPAALTDGTTQANVTAGTYYLYVCQYLGTTLNKYILASATYTVTGGAGTGEITLDPEEGPVDTEVEITGTGFAANEDIEIEFDGDEVDIEDGDDDTDSDGEFTTYILVPESTAGEQTITVNVNGSEAEAEFTVEPEIILNLTSAKAGTEVTVSGTGFGRRNDVTIWFDNIGIDTATTDSKGSFDATFSIPDLDAGIYDIDAEDEDENLDTTKFTIFVPSEPEPEPEPGPPPEPTPTPSATSGSISPAATGPVGADLIISGTGFEAGKAVTVKYGDEEIATAIATTTGILVAAFKVPVSEAGDHTITASDGTNTLELTFTVESKAPAIPAPLTPELGVRLKSPLFFDWKEVTDASSPVTYSLQIATDRDFEAASIVLEKKELTKSEYTFTSAEELELVDPQAPYYWRIRATDAASNEGEWTGAGEFYVTAPFSLPNWAFYTLIGLGGLVLFGIGYWLGRRTAFYY